MKESLTDCRADDFGNVGVCRSYCELHGDTVSEGEFSSEEDFSTAAENAWKFKGKILDDRIKEKFW